MDRIFIKDASGKIDLAYAVLSGHKLFNKIIADDKGSFVKINAELTDEHDDNGILKLQAKRVFLFVYYYAAWNSPYHFDEKEIRVRKAREASGLDKQIVRIGYKHPWAADEVADVVNAVIRWQYTFSPTLEIRDEKLRATFNEVNILKILNDKVDNLTSKLKAPTTITTPRRGLSSLPTVELDYDGITAQILSTIETTQAIGSAMTKIRNQIREYDNAVKAELQGAKLEFIGGAALGLTELPGSDLKAYL